MEFDDVLQRHVGQFGRYQIGVLLFISIENIFIAFHILSPVFLVGQPQHHCEIPALNLSACSQQDVLHHSIPLDEEGKLSSCQMYDRNYSMMTDEDVCPFVNNVSITSQGDIPNVACKSWVYDNSTFLNTMVTEWDLVCEDQYKASSVAALYMAGWITGLIVFGFLSDWVGRKPVVLGTGVAYVLAGMAVGLVPNLESALAMRFIQAFCGAGKTTATFVIMTEIVGPDWRTFVMVVYYLYWVAGYVLMAGLAYLIRNWRTLEVVLSTPEIIYFIFFVFLVPESPRWLLTKNRQAKAHAILHKMAKRNNMDCPKELKISNQKERIGTMLDLIRTPGLRRVTLILVIAWFANGFVYYGLSLNTSNLGGNPYLNFLISGSLELPAYLLLIPLLRHCGRVPTYSVFVLMAGVLLLCVIAVPPGFVWPVVTLSMVGKFCISCSFLIIWFYTVELYPTEIRSIGLNYISAISRVSAILAAYVELLDDIHRSLPLVVFGVIAVLSGITSTLLPETRGAALSQTVSQAEAFIQDSGCLSCCKGRQLQVEVGDENELETLNNDSTTMDI